MNMLSTTTMVCWEATLNDEEKQILALCMRLAAYKHLCVSAKVKHNTIKHWKLVDVNGKAVVNFMTFTELQNKLLEVVPRHEI